MLKKYIGTFAVYDSRSWKIIPESPEEREELNSLGVPVWKPKRKGGWKNACS